MFLNLFPTISKKVSKLLYFAISGTQGLINYYEITRDKKKSVLGPSPKDRICWWEVVSSNWFSRIRILYVLFFFTLDARTNIIWIKWWSQTYMHKNGSEILQQKFDKVDSKLYNQLMFIHLSFHKRWLGNLFHSLIILPKKEYLKAFNFCRFHQLWILNLFLQ